MIKKALSILSFTSFVILNVSPIRVNGQTHDSGNKAISIVSAGSGEATFSLTTTDRKNQVFLFAKRNGQQDLVLDGSNSIHASEIANADGTFTYRWTGRPSSGTYSDGDAVVCRFYTFDGSTQKFYPGPTDSDWSSTFTYGNGAVNYTIQSSADANGIITPSGAVSVGASGSETFTISTNAGYRIKNVIVDNQAFGALSSYTFTNVQANHSIQVETEVDQGQKYNLTIQTDGNGVTTPSSAISVQQNSSTTITATPNSGYQFSSWTVISGNAAIADAKAPSTSVITSSDAVIQASFKVKLRSNPENISITAAGNGKATFSLTTTERVVQSFLFTKKNGNYDKVIDGAAADAILNSVVDNGNGTYTYSWTGTPASGSYQNGDKISCRFFTFNGRTQKFYPGPDHSVYSSEYAYNGGGITNYSLTVRKTGNGATNITSTTVAQGAKASIIATPNSGSNFIEWKIISGSAVIADLKSASTTIELTSDATIEAAFQNGGGARQVVSSFVSTQGYRLLYQDVYDDGSTSPARDYAIKAVCWNPVRKGEASPPIFTHMYEIDAPLLAAANINTVKMYASFNPQDDGIRILDKLNQYGIKVIMCVFSGYYDDANNQHLAIVNKYKNHPAILMWQVGNEMNYNLLYTGAWTPVPVDQCINKVNAVIAQIKSVDSNHPVAVSWGYHPVIENGRRVPRSDYVKINNINADVFGIQYYPEYEEIGDALNCFVLKQPGLEHNTFEQYKNTLLTRKPMYMSEYGSDSYNVFIASEPGGHKYYDWSRSHVDEAAQAKGVKYMTLEIKDNLSKYNPDNVCVGGALFAWSDEWWKIWPYNTHEIGGYDPDAPGPDILPLYPDGFFNEEYFGIVDVDRNPKAAYYVLKDVYSQY
ncbi:MAG TPA: glycoside hydrolase family 2 TIM barrel-domain containing protein [Fibrobacteria bacterium]|nr:glycoside hydrolase family 2 TIM barrel-domain containing protein [Fibrobacteria bacterium]